MADFNKILTPGDIDGGVINVVVEIPTGSAHKIEWNRELAVFQLDRVEPAIFAKPTNSSHQKLSLALWSPDSNTAHTQNTPPQTTHLPCAFSSGAKSNQFEEVRAD